ncbi:metallophosphoesterase family protein [Corynebacterium oculi]|uniref:Calcineurin-like phosphoesterase n=1 Tax=Corynebacterium oculi TaxID=1544416 RepID=A0A0Q0UEI1_9CORY|nr:metallophosphoesterase [Corynebacterium oculi]KQB85078.1 Calcineurin-like phosphoesterase [Corynebacterium oculi]
MKRRTLLKAAAAASWLPALGSVSPAQASTAIATRPGVLFYEGFDEVPNPASFTHRLPEGWTSSVEGVTSGEKRWEGWTLATIRDWAWACGTDKRHWFTRGYRQVCIVDSKQQRLNSTDSMDAHLFSPEIDVTGHSTVTVEFDSHYRQGRKGQSAEVTAHLGDQEITLLQFTEDKFSSHEALSVEIPAGVNTLHLGFHYLSGNDDWFWAIDNVAVTTPLPEVAGPPIAIIDVLSDVQGDITDYEDAVRQLNAMPEPAHALVINGDAVDDGSTELWEEFEAATARTPHISGQTIMTAGNHEMYGDESSGTYIERFLHYSHSQDLWREVIINGIPIITLNSEYYSDVDRDGKEPFVRLSPDQLAWLDERLLHWQQRGVRVLLFAHYLLPGTVSMSHSAWYQNDYEDLEALSNVLSKYTHQIMFTSHSHASLLHQHDWWGIRRYPGTGEAGAIGFPVVNTGAILNAYMPEDDHDEMILDGRAASGLRVRVYDDRVRVEAWDFVEGEPVKGWDFRDAK